MTASTTSPITMIDLFSGCGGFTEGFRSFRPSPAASSPFRPVAAVEFNIAAASTYAANFGDWAGGTDHVFCGDIVEWNPSGPQAEADIILGGPPCQGFSGLGKEDPSDPRNQLWREYLRVVNAVKPKIFILENVDRFLNKSAEYQTFSAMAKPGGELSDYHLEPGVLNAADYGVAQKRMRTIVIGTRRDLPAMRHPEPTHRESPPGTIPGVNENAAWVPVSTVFSQTFTTPTTTELPEKECKPLGVLMPGEFRTDELHIGRNPTELSLARYASIRRGGNRHDIPPYLSTESWIRHRSGSGDVMGRLRWNEPSVTIRTEFFKPEKGRYLHPWANRPITHYEAALIQGFPRDFLWCGSKIEIARQIGNAVPVALARALARQVFLHLDGENTL
ncbi:DNA cytosine methyltransferase [Nonomuraea sp. NPDC049480]|uniref:DNA cytosine methyltransferase n=1 Tax=Nonomuraea sp. NPDC049480 TaxID=3364353 RepID=UPI00379122C2